MVFRDKPVSGGSVILFAANNRILVIDSPQGPFSIQLHQKSDHETACLTSFVCQ
jgi:hypothetical protein